MSYTLLEAAKTSRNPLTAGVLKAIATSDELMARVQMVQKNGEAFRYNREKALPTVEFVSPTHSSLAESSATFDQVTVPMRLIVSDVDVYLFPLEQQEDINNQMTIQVDKKLKALGRTIGQKLFTGSYASTVTFSASITGVASPVAGPNQDTTRHGPGSLFYDQSVDELSYRGPGDRTYGTPVDVSVNGTYVLTSDNPSKTLTVTVTSASLPGADAEVHVNIATTSEEWDGIQRLMPAGQIVSSAGADGDELSFGVMDELIDEKVKVRDGLHFVMHGKLKRKFFALARSLGGAGIEMIQLPGVVGPVPSYRGIPILQSDWIPTNESKGSGTTLSSLYLVSLSDEGFYLAHGGLGPSARADLDPTQTMIAGVKIRPIGELEGKEAMRTRLSFYGATALGSELAIARASELKTA